MTSGPAILIYPAGRRFYQDKPMRAQLDIRRRMAGRTPSHGDRPGDGFPRTDTDPASKD